MDVSELKERIVMLESKVSELESMIDANAGDIDGLEFQLAYASEELTMLNANLAVMKTSLSEGCPSGMTFQRMTDDGTVICADVPTGDSGSGQLERVSRSATISLVAFPFLNMTGTVTALCPPGMVSTGGGFGVAASPANTSLLRSAPYLNSGWTVMVMVKTNVSVVEVPVTAYVNCVTE